MLRLLLTVLLTLLAVSAHAGEPPTYSAHTTLQRAQVGTYSTRAVVMLRKPVRTRPTKRMDCYQNPSAPRTITCESRRVP